MRFGYKGHSVRKETEFLQRAENLSISLFKVLGEVIKCEENMSNKGSKKKLSALIKMKKNEMEKDLKRYFDVSSLGYRRRC
jgi:hypothetical protein